MLECLQNKVVWKEVCVSPPIDAVYINDLPGYPTQAFELLTNQDSITDVDIWDKLNRRAKRTILSDVESTLSEKFQVRTIVDNIETGNWLDPFSANSLEDHFKGEVIGLIESPNLNVYIESVEVHSLANETGQIYIYDIERGVLLDSIDYDFSESTGFFTVDIGKRYTANNIFVCYDASVLASYNTSQNGSGYFQNICKPCNCKATSSKSAYILKSDQVVYSNLVYNVNSGIRVKYSLQCALDNWICSNVNRVSNAYLYLLGIELATEIMASDRVNQVTLIHEDKLSAFASYCDQGYRKELKNLARGAQIKDSICMPCRSKIKKVSFHP